MQSTRSVGMGVNCAFCIVGSAPAISRISLRRIAWPNCSLLSMVTIKDPKPPITQSE